jgi:hypothetical protein
MTGRDAGLTPRERGEKERIVTNRTMTTAVAGRASSMRRLRRRASATNRAYCSTNGCASFLRLDPASGIASCPICGFQRRQR